MSDIYEQAHDMSRQELADKLTSIADDLLGLQERIRDAAGRVQRMDGPRKGAPYSGVAASTVQDVTMTTAHLMLSSLILAAAEADAMKRMADAAE